jgi:uncharacterized protein (DUF362 family)
MKDWSRRGFFRMGGSALAGVALSGSAHGQQIPPPVPATPVFPYDARSPVSLVKGEVRRKNVTEALLAIDREIRPVLKRKKYVAIKVNNVTARTQLAATHVDALRGILDYLAPRFKGPVVIVESSMDDRVNAFEYYKYAQVIPEYKRFNVRLIDLNLEGKYELCGIVDQNIRPVGVRLAARLLDPDAYIISAAMLKIHNAVVATGTIKNMAMGAPLRGKAEGQPRAWSDKGLMHAGRRLPAAPRGAAQQDGRSGSPRTARGGAMMNRGPIFHAMNYNLAVVAKKLGSAWGCGVIDGFEGMEGDGPIAGTAVPMGVALASPDLVAVDRIALELMGVPHHAVGYLQYAGQLGVGQYDIEKIDIRGERPESVQRKFKLHPSVQQHVDWLNDIARQS